MFAGTPGYTSAAKKGMLMHPHQKSHGQRQTREDQRSDNVWRSGPGVSGNGESIGVIAGWKAAVHIRKAYPVESSRRNAPCPYRKDGRSVTDDSINTIGTRRPASVLQPYCRLQQSVSSRRHIKAKLTQNRAVGQCLNGKRCRLTEAGRNIFTEIYNLRHTPLTPSRVPRNRRDPPHWPHSQRQN